MVMNLGLDKKCPFISHARGATKVKRPVFS
jgi:hypothetical protein